MKQLMAMPMLERFYLVGGTALALQLGHIFPVIKSLTYFEDAEQFPDPVVFDEKITWLKVKKAVREAAKELR